MKISILQMGRLRPRKFKRPAALSARLRFWRDPRWGVPILLLPSPQQLFFRGGDDHHALLLGQGDEGLFLSKNVKASQRLKISEWQSLTPQRELGNAA